MKRIVAFLVFLLCFTPYIMASQPTYTGPQGGLVVGTASDASNASLTVNDKCLFVAGTGEVYGNARIDGSLTHGSRIVTPTTQYGITTSSALVVTSAFMVIKSTGSLTSAATPFISTTTATSGQIVEILNGDSSYTFTIKDKGTLSNSCLSLGGTTRAIGPGDSIVLYYYDGVWRERGFSDCQAY